MAQCARRFATNYANASTNATAAADDPRSDTNNDEVLVRLGF